MFITTIQSEPLQTRTAEGLALGLHVSFQYKLNRTTIPQLYNLTNVNYAGTLNRIARDVILKVGGMFNATNYWTDRKKIGDYMKEQLNSELKKTFARYNKLHFIFKKQLYHLYLLIYELLRFCQFGCFDMDPEEYFIENILFQNI